MYTFEYKSPLPEGSPELYLRIGSDGTVSDLDSGNTLYPDFNTFLWEIARSTLEKEAPPYANDFLVHYRFDRAEQIPRMKPYEKIPVFRDRLLEKIARLRLQPERTLRLHDVLHCYERRINPLHPDNAPEKLHARAEFVESRQRYMPQGGAPQRLSYYGMATDRGVLLFDDSEQGRQRMEAYRMFHARRFFHPGMKTPFLNVTDVVITPALKPYVNPHTGRLAEPEADGSLAKTPPRHIVTQSDIPI